LGLLDPFGAPNGPKRPFWGRFGPFWGVQTGPKRPFRGQNDPKTAVFDRFGVVLAPYLIDPPSPTIWTPLSEHGVSSVNSGNRPTQCNPPHPPKGPFGPFLGGVLAVLARPTPTETCRRTQSQSATHCSLERWSQITIHADAISGLVDAILESEPVEHSIHRWREDSPPQSRLACRLR